MTDQVNIPLLRKAVEWAEAEAAKPPELCEWVQADWCIPPNPERRAQQRIRANKASTCGTTYCIAGYIVHALDLPLTVQEDGGLGWGEAAAEALGLTYDRNDWDDSGAGNRLFKSDNTIADVRRIAEEIAGERL